MRNDLTPEQINSLYSGLHEYVSTDTSCPNCLSTQYNISAEKNYTSYTCLDCSYDYYAINGETRLI
jgi:transposase-like protein